MTDHDLKELELRAAAKRDDETVSIEAGKLRELLRQAAWAAERDSFVRLCGEAGRVISDLYRLCVPHEKDDHARKIIGELLERLWDARGRLLAIENVDDD